MEENAGGKGGEREGTPQIFTWINAYASKAEMDVSSLQWLSALG